MFSNTVARSLASYIQMQLKASGFLNGSHLRFEVTAEGNQEFNDKWSVGNQGIFFSQILKSPGVWNKQMPKGLWGNLAWWISIQNFPWVVCPFRGGLSLSDPTPASAEGVHPELCLPDLVSVRITRMSVVGNGYMGSGSPHHKQGLALPSGHAKGCGVSPTGHM